MFIPSPQPIPSVPIEIDPVKGIIVTRIIWAAMMMGLITFMIVTLIVANQPRPNLPVISFIGLGFGVFQIGLRYVLPNIVIRSQIHGLAGIESEKLDSRLFAAYQTKIIVALALLEGAGFFNLVGFMMERQWWTLAFVGFLLILMAMIFPTLAQFEYWAEEKKRDLQNQF